MPPTIATRGITTSVGRWMSYWSELSSAYVYAPIPKKATKPRSSRPPHPTTMLRPSASSMKTTVSNATRRT